MKPVNKGVAEGTKFGRVRMTGVEKGGRVGGTINVMQVGAILGRLTLPSTFEDTPIEETPKSKIKPTVDSQKSEMNSQTAEKPHAENNSELDSTANVLASILPKTSVTAFKPDLKVMIPPSNVSDKLSPTHSPQNVIPEEKQLHLKKLNENVRKLRKENAGFDAISSAIKEFITARQKAEAPVSPAANPSQSAYVANSLLNRKSDFSLHPAARVEKEAIARSQAAICAAKIR